MIGACAVLLSILLLPGALHSEEKIDPGASRTGPSLPTLAPLIKRILPAVVAVRTSRLAAEPRTVDPAGGFPEDLLPHEMEGSGIIVDAQRGLVVTSTHVVENAETITVTLTDGRSAHAVLLTSTQDDDLAVLRVALHGISAVSLAQGQGPEVGDFAIAVGNPLGLGQSVTFGIVSALHRSCPGIKDTDLIQTDALLDRGDSGGGLFNLKGELVGINVARIGRAGAGGFGFAVPIDAVRAILASVSLDF
jgi:S1-C subfamily serine protease